MKIYETEIERTYAEKCNYSSYGRGKMIYGFRFYRESVFEENAELWSENGSVMCSNIRAMKVA